MAEDAKLYQLWLDRVDEGYLQDELARMKGDQSAIADAFFQDLEFGTAGLRGIIGAGTNRMNVYTVGRATQGFADYLNQRYEAPSVVIGRDSRNGGEQFARRSAEVLAANGVKAYVFPRIVPTPVVSFAVRDLGCSGGINITASHNPAEYNGYKAYNHSGCQVVTEEADAISAAASAVDMFDGVKAIDFDEALASGLVEWVSEDVLDRFIDAVAACSVATPEDKKTDLKLVYTPLNGTGLECVTRILKREGITDIALVDEQKDPDGNFPTCPYPNPEIREALELAIQLAERVHPDLLLATDPDADRVGIGVKQGDDYQLLTGNEVGVLLLDYLARQQQAAGQDLSRKVAVTTIVSSSMVDAIAQAYGFEVHRVLTGFKYIGEYIGQLEALGQQDRFLFGFEESYGYLNGTHVRDKDAVDASMLICQMAQYYKARGMNLAQAMDALYQQHGYYLNRTSSFSYPGASGAEKMHAIMAQLRENPPAGFADLDVQEVVDYEPGVNGLPPANVIQFNLEGSNKIVVRPSGTEPKIKVYVFAKQATRQLAEELLAQLEEASSQLLSAD